MNAGRQRLRKRAPWFPETLSYDFYERHPNLDVFIARAGYLFGLLFIGLLIVVAIRGLF